MNENRNRRDTALRYRGRFLAIEERDGWEFASRVNASGVAVIIAVTPAEEIVLVEQRRIPVNNSVVELPAGLVGDQGRDDEPLEEAALRELWEETGYRPGRLDAIARCPSSAGMSDEVLTFFLASDVLREGAGGGDDSEDIIVHTVPLAEVDQWLAGALSAGKALDPKIYTALYWLERRGTLDALLPPVSA